MSEKPVLIVIAGPTAVGKTDLSLHLAQLFETDIISADSRQCFRELNIGTAKPSEEELTSVPHHFINTHSVTEEVTAYDFEKYALNTLEDIFKKKDIAIVCGGTGLYIKALCEGLDEMPKTDASIVTQIESDYALKGISWLQEELQEKDPLFYATAEQDNPVRLIRALAFFKTTGKSINLFKKEEKKERFFDVLKIALNLDREVLYQRINERVDRMVEDGLENEARNLQQYQNLKNLKTVGYSEWFAYFNQEITYDKAVDKIKQHSRNYAKRQLTWFRKDKEFKWFHPQDKKEITDYIHRSLLKKI